MRALDIVLFLFFINLGIGISAEVLTGYTGLGYQGSGWTEETMPSDNEINPQTGAGKTPFEHLTDPLSSFTNPFKDPKAVGFLIGLIVSAAFVTGVFGVPAMQALPLAIFGGVFWWLWTNTNQILATLEVPGWLIGIITVIFGGVYFIGMMDYASGRDVERKF